MATISAPFLSAPAQEDSMELSSPRNRPLDEDIEIDFEEDYGTANMHDEQMVDDADHDDIVVQDEDMLQFEEDEPTATADDPQRVSTIADEDLIDYSDEEEQVTVSPPRNQAQPSDAQQQVAPPADKFPQVQLPEDDHVAINTSDAETKNAVPHVETADAVESSEESADEVERLNENASQAEPDALVQPVPETVFAADALTNTGDAKAVSPQDSNSDEPEEGVLKPRLSTTFVPLTDGPGTPTDTGLHPVTLYFEDQEFPLFRSRTSIEGLLKDDNLVSVSLADLIKACKQSIIIKTKKEIDENLELIFTFDDLSLSVYEDAPAAFQTSLQEVLDVYLHLQANDGHEKQQIPPLTISCTLHVKFNNSIVVLKNAADRGEGLSSLIPQYEEELPAELHEEEEVYNEDGEHGHTEEYEGQYQETYEDAEKHEVGGESEHWEAGHEGEDGADTVEAHDAASHFEGVDNQPTDAAEDHDHDQDEPPEISTDAVHGQLGAAENTTQADREGHDSLTDEADTAAQVVAEPSEESSTTLPALSGTPTPQNEADDHDADAALSHVQSNDDEASAEIQDGETLRDSDATPSEILTEQLHGHDSTEAISNEPAEHESAGHARHDEELASPHGEQPRLEAPTTDIEAAGSEFELDLEDYDRPDPSVTTSPAVKRQRDVDDTTTDQTTAKKLRPS